MGQIKGIKYGYNDINIVPEKNTILTSRKLVTVEDENEMLPIFASPMDSVIDDKNYFLFEECGIYTVIPRTVSLSERINIAMLNVHSQAVFIALSLKEANFIFLDDPLTNNLSASDLYETNRVRKFLAKDDKYKTIKICIDLANGHMKALLKTIEKIKKTYGDKVIVMSGNIANPETYKDYEKAKCDYVRVSIGSGEGCSTSTNTGVHYPIFSLIEEIYRIKEDIQGHCKIIADGGIKGYGDIQKALIYADYVMIGGLFSRMVESAGEKYYGKSYWKIRGRRILRPLKTLFTYGRKAKEINYKKLKKGTQEYYKVFKGMSTPEAQMAIRKAEDKPNVSPLKPTEGVVKKVKVDMELEEWVRCERSYLASMMTYIDATNLYECKDANWIVKQSKNHN